ncbi:hypothetical protein chiPu_0010695 [Chiloscyllium punctatum]|uniref:Uncharacterized protein n=1 Tax=Chiloscyllium punctatum TaxID=137246 RepID=A0A401SPA8_CHIPU|nr:hypothetical protein [Chiloscyllium punctatum]
MRLARTWQLKALNFTPIAQPSRWGSWAVSSRFWTVSPPSTATSNWEFPALPRGQGGASPHRGQGDARRPGLGGKRWQVRRGPRKTGELQQNPRSKRLDLRNFVYLQNVMKIIPSMMKQQGQLWASFLSQPNIRHMAYQDQLPPEKIR